MAIRTALLNGNNVNRDSDFSKYIETISEPGVIEGLEVSASKVAIGKARVPCERTNGETIYALVYITSEVSISGDGEVYIKVNQTYVDDGELANEDGTGIATVEVGTMPSKNALKLATITSGVPTDERNMIKKVGELNTQINSIFDSIDDLDTRVEHLEEQGAVDHLEESGLVGEKYTLDDEMYRQPTPVFGNCTTEVKVGDNSARTQIHIQRIGSGVVSNKLKLSVKATGEPTQNLIVEVRKGVKVDSGTEIYWYGDEVIATGSIPYSEITSEYSEKEITLNGDFGETRGELLDIVVYQNGNIVNSTNYYCLGADNKQTGEAFRCLGVNGETRTAYTTMPYCISDGFEDSLFVKFGGSQELTYDANCTSGENRVYNQEGTIQNTTVSYVCGITAPYKIMAQIVDTSYGGSRCTIKVNDNTILNQKDNSNDGTTMLCNTGFVNCNKGDIITITHADEKGSSWAGTRKLTYIKIYTQGVDSLVEKVLYPTEIKDVGQRTGMASTGKKEDGTYISEFDFNMASTAQTGGITLGNAVGYIKLKYKGIIYKVPVYG